ncbi:MAG: rhamnogalacturonan acetylesterase [Paludibacter sp.]|nr:rhamnogalacturonan acetylesterase [Paludibacter sp.]
MAKLFMKTSKKFIYSLIIFTVISCVSAKNTTKKPTLFTIGDSTMADNRVLQEDPGDPGRGWGQCLSDYFDANKIIVKNMAVSGRSTKSYIDEGKWEAVRNQLSPGDYVLIQFGHNDQKKEDIKRYTDPQTSFKSNLKLFIEETRNKKAVPLLATPIVRRRFDNKGELVETLGDYINAVKEVGKELNVQVIDMNELTHQRVEELGPEESKKLYLWIAPGVAERFPEGSKDDTHLCVLGATEFTNLFISELTKSKHPLTNYLLTK